MGEGRQMRVMGKEAHAHAQGRQVLRAETAESHCHFCLSFFMFARIPSRSEALKIADDKYVYRFDLSSNPVNV